MLARFRARGDARRRAGSAPHAPGGARGGMLPPAGLFCVLDGIARRVAATDAAGRRPCRRSMRPGRACRENGWISLFLQMVLQ